MGMENTFEREQVEVSVAGGGPLSLVTLTEPTASGAGTLAVR